MATSVTVFIFVEGQDIDPYFYGEVCEPVFSAGNLRYEIMGAWWLAESGGKGNLIGFYDYLAATNSLLTTFQGKRMAVIFFLDKDIDDVLHSKRYSDHIVYTQHYSVENYLFAEGDLPLTAASASSLERREFTGPLGDGSAWRRTIAEAWKDWVTFCVFSEKHRVSCGYNYRLAKSTINDPLDVPPSKAVVQGHRATLRDKSGLTHKKFDKAFRAVARLVDGYYRRGLFDHIFKGKWYVAPLEEQVERIAAGRPYNRHALRNSIISALGPTLNFSAPWTEHFRVPLRALVARL